MQHHRRSVDVSASGEGWQVVLHDLPPRHAHAEVLVEHSRRAVSAEVAEGVIEERVVEVHRHRHDSALRLTTGEQTQSELVVVKRPSQLKIYSVVILKGLKLFLTPASLYSLKDKDSWFPLQDADREGLSCRYLKLCV